MGCGPVRDLDVLLEHLAAEVAQLDADVPDGSEIVRMLSEQRDEFRAKLVEAMSSPRYASLLDLFVRSIAFLPPLPAGDSATAIARAELRKLRKAAKALPGEPSDAELHRLRIKAKRARYAAELAELAGAKGARDFVAAAKRLQDVIGEHQDAAVAEERLRRYARPGWLRRRTVGRARARAPCTRAQGVSEGPRSCASCRSPRVG